MAKRPKLPPYGTKMTNWIPGSIKPVRRGWYLCRDLKFSPDHTQFDWWNGSAWCKEPGAKPFPKRTQDIGDWCGLIKEQE